MGHPSLPKRPHDDASEISSTDNPPSKKAKSEWEIPPEDTPGVALQQLDNGLVFLERSHNYSEQIKGIAQQLRQLLESDAKTKTLESTDRVANSEHTRIQSRKQSHTDVPPPIQAPKVPGYNGPPPPSAVVTVVESSSSFPGLPPLPPITDLTLLTAPFTHSSTLPNYVPSTNTNTYEPLEFLGDAYIEIIATRIIHNRLPEYNVGQKSGLRESLVKNETLAQFARGYGFTDRIKVAGSELQTRSSTKILADVFEAYVACIILSDNERGFTIAEEWLGKVWEPKVQEWLRTGAGKLTQEPETLSMDVKSELQKHLVSKGVKLEYIEDRPMELIKDGNKTTFFVSVFLTGWGYDKVKLGSGTGRNKQIAGAEAAKNAFIYGKAIVDDAHRKKIEHDKLNQAQRNTRQVHSGNTRTLHPPPTPPIYHSPHPHPPHAGRGMNGGSNMGAGMQHWQR